MGNGLDALNAYLRKTDTGIQGPPEDLTPGRNDGYSRRRLADGRTVTSGFGGGDMHNVADPKTGKTTTFWPDGTSGTNDTERDTRQQGESQSGGGRSRSSGGNRTPSFGGNQPSSTDNNQPPSFGSTRGEA
jgi:hypothetical protein